MQYRRRKNANPSANAITRPIKLPFEIISAPGSALSNDHEERCIAQRYGLTVSALEFPTFSGSNTDFL